MKSWCVAGDYGSSGFTCEQDEYAELVKQIKASGIVKSNGSFFWSYKDTFKGKELVDWLIKSKDVHLRKTSSESNPLFSVGLLFFLFAFTHDV